MIFASWESATSDIAFWVFVGVVAFFLSLIGIAVLIDHSEEKQRRKEVELAAEKERRRENRDKTAKVMERGQRRQHKHERETQYPARPKQLPRQTRPALPPAEDD